MELPQGGVSAHSLKTKWLDLACVIYASSAFGWIFVMKHLILTTSGVLYSVSMVLLCTAFYALGGEGLTLIT
jgi:hypothetical protein